MIPHRENTWQQPPLAQVDQPPPKPNLLHPSFSRVVQPPTNHAADGTLSPRGAGVGATRLADYAGGVSTNIYNANNPSTCEQRKKLTDLVQKNQNLKSLEKAKTDEKIQKLETQLSKAISEVTKSRSESKKSEASLQGKIE